MRFSRYFVGTMLLAACLALPARAQVTLGQIDTFEDGTTQGWTAGGFFGSHPAPPQNIVTGGPAGADDNFLLLTAIGGTGVGQEPGSRLSAFNTTRWAGNYLAAGITAVRMDAINLGSSELHLRLLFADPQFGPPSNIAITDSIVLPAGSGWQRLTFSITPASLTGLLGSVTTALSNATEMRIFHNPALDFPGPPFGIPPVVAQLGVDNIQAIPEASSAALMGIGLLGLLLERRRRLRVR